MTEQQSNTLVPIETYLKAGIHIGTKFKTKYMSKFIYKARPDGLFILDLEKIDNSIRMVIDFLSQYAPEEIVIVSRRENGWRPSALFAKYTGATVFAGRYPPGTLTNANLKTFIEAKVMLVTDAWPDRNAVKDGFTAGIPIIALCDSNNQTNNLDVVIPCNNKGRKSLALFFHLLTKGYMEKRGLGALDLTAEDFGEE